MHIQIVNYNLDGLTEAEFRAHCDEVAPAFAAVPGLLAKFWLADPMSNTYGGVYVWRDESAMRAFGKSELFKAGVANPHYVELTSRSFDTLAGPTEVTRGSVLQGALAQDDPHPASSATQV
jgi:heme-degrading monooxygenase HmoA